MLFRSTKSFASDAGWNPADCVITLENSVFKSIPVEMKDDDSNPRTIRISGYLSTFKNADTAGDIMLPGAFDLFAKTRKTLPMLKDHGDQFGMVRVDTQVGEWGNFSIDEVGLAADGSIMDTESTEHMAGLVKCGFLKTCSIAGLAKYKNDRRPNKKGFYEIEQAFPFECSIVVIPANPKATFMKKNHELNAKEVLTTEMRTESPSERVLKILRMMNKKGLAHV